MPPPRKRSVSAATSLPRGELPPTASLVALPLVAAGLYLLASALFARASVDLVKDL